MPHQNPLRRRSLFALILAFAFAAALLHRLPESRADSKPAPTTGPTSPLCISGVYPHLAVFSQEGEVGIGAIVPWAGKLWEVTYPPHKPKGSPDKLYTTDADLHQEIRPESVGGTHAGRMIHKESNQLIIGPYFIDDKGNVRVADITKLVGRLTAVARHLTDPANMVYIYDMEGAVYEVNVHTLAAKKLFQSPIPGVHGKGAYTAQGRLIIANNGEKGYRSAPVSPPDAPAQESEDAGGLGEWDGKKWTLIERRPFTEITTAGGINGAPDDKSPAWTLGWDRRSVLLKLLDSGTWSTFRLPKGSHTYDAKHGWYTEWPRIREAAPGKLLMDMHAIFYNFPSTFSASNTAGISPISTHLRYIPDFCLWNNRLVISSDDASLMQNPMDGQSQSNLWFGTLDDLSTFGPASGWGGVWDNDPVTADQPSLPFLINGFDRRIVHLSHDAAQEVKFSFEIDVNGDNKWTPANTVAVPAKGYASYIFPADFKANWIRVKADHACNATAYFHFNSYLRPAPDDRFAALADLEDKSLVGGIIRPGEHNRNLQCVLQNSPDARPEYLEVNETLKFEHGKEDRSKEVTAVASVTKDFEVDDASVIMTQDNHRYRLPKGNAAFDKPTSLGWPRGIRECESERYMMNIHGTFYEMPRQHGMPFIKPICSHNKQILDFCTWRGLLVMSGLRADAKPDGHCFTTPDGKTSLWFGAIDDFWRLGPPVGVGGPWAKTSVKADEPSDPYLMTGYNKKRLELSQTSNDTVNIKIEIDFNHNGYRTYQTIAVPPGKTITHEFPDGFSAHWIRVTADKPCVATAWLAYER